MSQPPRMGIGSWVGIGLVLILAGVTRFWYVAGATQDGIEVPTLAVQGQGTRAAVIAGEDESGRVASEVLVENLVKERWFSTFAPLADAQEQTAHLSPGYPWLRAWLTYVGLGARQYLLALHGVLGVLTVLALMFFARWAFSSAAVTFVTGLLAALHPFWIVNTAEVGDGTVTTFLLAVALFLGARGGKVGGYLTSFLLGLSLACLSLIRAELLIFAAVGLLWYIYRCRLLHNGLLYALLVFLGFGNGVGLWSFRNWQLYGEPVPIANSAFLHLFMGNNPKAHGGPLTEEELRQALTPERLQEIQSETRNQTRRYARLGKDAYHFMREEPGQAVALRLAAGMKFLVGENWWQTRRMVAGSEAEPSLPPPAALSVEALHQGTLLGLLILGGIGWRMSYSHAHDHRLAALALLLIPLPYLLSHADQLVGPRLPWDALLIAFSAYALVGWLPREETT